MSDLALMIRERTRRRLGPRILVVDELVPDPLFGAGYPRAFAIVNELVGLGCDVHFYALSSPRRDVARMRRAFAGRVFFFPSGGADGLDRVVGRYGRGFDILFISRPGPMREFADRGWTPSPGGRPCIIYDAEAVLSPREARRERLFGDLSAANAYDDALAAELGPARAADVVSAVGEDDAALISATIGKPVVVLAHSIDSREVAPTFAERKDFLFVGRMTGPRIQSPNVDSVLWFVTDIMPILDRLIGSDYRLHLAGLQQGSEIEALPSERIVSHGTVGDLTALYDRCRVFVAPTRFAAGIPQKVTDAMGQGLPCVATPLLAGQLGVGSDILPTGESAQAFAEQCARLYRDDVAWSGVREAALAHVARRYSRDAFRRSLLDLLARAGAASPSADRHSLSGTE